jgi:hypothetical protein
MGIVGISLASMRSNERGKGPTLRIVLSDGALGCDHLDDVPQHGGVAMIRWIVIDRETRFASTMTLAEVLYHASFIVTVAVNAGVVIYVFPMWKQGKQRFFALFGWSGMLGVFDAVAVRYLENVPMDPQQYYSIWCGVGIVGIADLVLYGLGTIELVRHFKKVQGRDEGKEHRDGTERQIP